ncbi:MAG: hypothetical protein C4295_12350 [Candidatus Fervidibacterota bacterium]
MRWVLLAVVVLTTVAVGQNLVPNPSFERGKETPSGWQLNGGMGKWETFGRTGSRSLSVTGTGTDSNAWECTDWRPESGQRYLLRYFVCRSPKSAGGTPITGFSTVNRDAWDVPPDGNWHRRQFVCRTPINRPNTILRFGQWHMKGTVSYDDVEVLPVVAVHKCIGTETTPLTPVSPAPSPLSLGTGESIRKGVYRFSSNFAGFASNDARPLFAHTAGFNTDRWVLGGPMSERWQESGAWVIYRHSVGFPLTAARLEFVVGYYESGQLVVEVSTDGRQWREVGRFSSADIHTVSAPNDLFPAKELWVRFWATGTLQVHHYRVEAPLSGNPPDAVGETWYFAVRQEPTASDLTLEPVALTETALRVRVQNKAQKARQVELTFSGHIDRSGVSRSSLKVSRLKMLLPANSEQGVTLPLPPLAAGEQVVVLTLREGAKVMFAAEATVQKPWIEVGGFGSHLATTDALTIWWCEPTYKVGRTTPSPPSRPLRPIRLEAARNEYEPFWLVLKPLVPLQRLRFRVSSFQSVKSSPHPQSPVPVWDEIAFVDYVPVTVPTDARGAVGEYPDPLIPLWRRDRWQGTTGTGRDQREKSQPEVVVENLQANRNQPLWLTVFVPNGVSAGTYRATIQIVESVGIDGKPISTPKFPLPVELRVFDFTLPDDTPLRTAYGVGIDNDWHRLRTPEQFRQVWDLYMQICRRYRISPYTPHAYAPIRWETRGPCITVDNGILQLLIDRWQGRIATIAWRAERGAWRTVGGILPLLEQFEREGVGWEGRGIGWCGAEVISDIQFVERSEQRVVMDITAERISSAPAHRKFAATVRLTVEAGKPFVTVQLRRLVNTDTIRWRGNGYYHLLSPDLRPSDTINTHRFGSWLFPDTPLAFGAAGEGFAYSIRINPQTGGRHGDVFRTVGKWLEPNEVWMPEDEPTAFVFVWDKGQGAGDMERQRQLTEFAEQVLRGEVLAQAGAVVRIAEQPEPKFRYDFTEFDKAMERYLDEFRFNGFNLVILPETLGGHPRFTPEWTALYKKLMAPILEHLQERGWLQKAYCYWVDEPPPTEYENVKQGMLALKEAASGIRRLLTFCHDKAPLPFFYDAVDLWVPVSPLLDTERAKERQALGEEVWWYVCTGPKQPYPNHFIDHPALTHRIRFWMAAKWNLDGDLYWSMTYYRGKGGRLRNPYEDGQSETPEGGYWGNGDGRLLYPPVRQPLPEEAEPVISPPIPSLRLAIIAEGIEDHIYLWLLKRLKEKGHRTGDKSKELQQALKQAEEAMGALERLIRSQTDYELDPQKLHTERRKIAEAIERLTKLLE